MKKVLASVLAGSMILGMASMASAASLVPADKSKDYDFYMVDMYGDENVIPADVEVALEAYTAAYNKVDAMTEDVTVGDIEDIYDTYKAVYDEAIAANPKSTVLKKEVAEIAKTSKSQFVKNFKKVNTSIGYCTAGTTASITGTAKFGAALDLKGVKTPEDVEKDLIAAFGADVANGNYAIENRDEFELKQDGEWYHLFNFGKDGRPDRCDKVVIQVPVKKNSSLRVDVASGPVTITRKKADTRNGVDYYDLTIKAAADVRTFEPEDFKIEVELKDANIVFFLKGKVAYSDWQYAEPGRVIRADRRSEWDADHEHGCVFNFEQPIDEELRIICNDYVDVLFNGNYGTDFENMRVLTDKVQEVEDFFQDYDIDYYDFIGLPKFAKDVTVRVDADSDAYIYEFDKKTGDVVDITDECEYTSNGMTFKRKALKTYVVLEEPYEGGNVRADKEPVDDEPTEPDDTDATGSKPNPGTGAMPF